MSNAKDSKAKIIVIVGQTASGKSELAVNIAKLIDAEIISADSRQIYKELNLTSGKISREEMQNVPHYMLDIRSVRDGLYNAYDFAKEARYKIIDIIKKGKNVIIIGGTGFYIDALLGEVTLSAAKQDSDLRAALEQKSEAELFEYLKRLDSKKADKIDKYNKHRLIRAIEIALQEKDGDLQENELPELPDAEIVWIGIKWPKEILRERIKKRLLERYKQGMCKEIENLIAQGVDEKVIDSLGLEMRYCLKLIKGKLSESKFLKELENKIWQYAKRQATYWKRNKKIKWFDASNLDEIYKYIKTL